MFAELIDEPQVYLGIFEQLEAEMKSQLEFDWDTSLPELDEPWPHHPQEMGMREMLAWLTGRTDVTGYLYEAHQLEEYERTGTVPWEDDMTKLMDQVMSDV